MAATLSPSPKQQFFDANGNPLVGGKLYSYVAGTTSPLATYVDSAGSTTNTNPIILDSRGEANVWLGANTYKLALYSAVDVLIWTVDDISAAASDTLAALAASGGSSLVGYLPAGTGAVATTVQAKLRESVSVMDFGAIPNSQASAAANLVAFNAAFAAAYANKVPVRTDGQTYYLSDTLLLPDIQQLASGTVTAGFVWETDNTQIICTDTSKQAVLSVPVSAAFKAGYTHVGKLHLSYITQSASGIGFNLNNLHHSDFGEIYTSNCDTGFYGKSCFAVTWVAFRGYLARISAEFNPLAAGSAGTACTSLKGAVYSILSAHGMKFINNFYSDITGFADSSSLGATYLPAGEVPIALNIGGGTGSTYKLGVEQWQGCIVRCSAGSTFATVDLGLITTIADQWNMTTTYSNVPVAQNALVSVADSCALILNSATLGNTTWLNASPVNLVYVGSDSTVTHTGGFLLVTGLQAAFVQVAGNLKGYKPVGNRFNNFSPTIYGAIPLEGLVIQNVDVVLSGVGTYVATWPSAFVFMVSVTAQVISAVTYDDTKSIELLGGYGTTSTTFWTNHATAETVRVTAIGKIA